MPSGKKARGRQNRAKKEAARTADNTRLWRTLWEPTILGNGGVVARNGATSSCEHLAMLPAQIPQEGPVVSFMNYIAGKGFFSNVMNFQGESAELCFRSLWHFPEVTEEESERSLATALLLRFIRNVFVHDSVVQGEKWFHNRAGNEVMICCMINALELLGTSDELAVLRGARATGNRLAGGNRRDVVKFVAKRVPCACLKKLHGATRKKVAKIGTCFGCKKKVPRSQLYVCTGCMAAEYCSKECQRANWSHHKPYCQSSEVSGYLGPNLFICWLLVHYSWSNLLQEYDA